MANLRVGDVLEQFDEKLGTRPEPEVLTLTERRGFIPQSERFNKRLATEDTSGYKVVRRHDIAFNPYLLWAGAIAQNTAWDMAIISPAYPTFRVRKNFDPRFVSYRLASEQLRVRYDSISFGAVPRRRRAATESFLELEFGASPPIGEQHRIASILDKADALRTQRRKSLLMLDELTVATFHGICGPCLGPPISIGKPSQRDADKYVPLIEVARLATGHTPSRRVPEYWGGQVPWMSLSDIRRLDGRVAEETEQYTTEAGIANSSAVVLPKDTVCFSRTASVGFATILGREMATSQDFVNWICGKRINPFYLLAAFRASKQYLISKSTGSTHKTIYFPVAERFHVFLPDAAKQILFAEALGKIWRLRTALESQLPSTDQAFESLQQRAFVGAL